MLLKDKVCVIVGAASLRSIGYATAELFALQGARVVAVDIAMDEIAADAVRASIEKVAQRPAEMFGAKCDIRSYTECRQLFRDVVSRYGTIDCMVNCAGVVKAQGMLEIEDVDYDRMMDVNLKGTFNICKSVLKVFADRKRGAIVNLDRIKELQPYFKGEHIVVLHDGTRLKLSKSRRADLEARLGQAL